MSKRRSESFPKYVDLVEEYKTKYPGSERHAIRDLIRREHPEINIRRLNTHLAKVFPEKKRRLNKKSLILEVKMFQEHMLPAKPLVVRKQAAKDLMALASRKEFPIETVGFLVDNWNKPDYVDVQKYFLRALWRAAVSLKGDARLLNKMTPAMKEILELAGDANAPPELRGYAWGLLVDIGDQRRIGLAFGLMKRPEEEEIVLGFVRRELVSYANENPVEATKRLYDILSELPQLTEEQTKKQQEKNKHTNAAYQRVTSLLKEIRSQS